MISRFEELTRKYLSYYFNGHSVFYNERPDFLKNRQTGYNFELDIWYNGLGLAIEVNGIAHKLKGIRERDEFKMQRCRKMHIDLFQVRHVYDILRLRKRILAVRPDLTELNKEIPFLLRKEFWDYKPNKQAFGGLNKKVHYELWREKVEQAQKEETKRNARRMRLREMNLLKKQKGT